MKPILLFTALMTAGSIAHAALIVTEFGLGPDGEEFVVVANTSSGPAINLFNVTISVNNGGNFSPIGTNILQIGETAILARQSLGSFAATYGFAAATSSTYFVSVPGLDFVESGASSIIISESGVPFYGVAYGAQGSGGYTGDLCIVDNSGGTPTTSQNTTPFSTIPEPGSAMLSAFALLGLMARRRRN